mmetsp:Transcript_46811/g.111370  ORF Transcript_46811/g.111370 Transcript_46811/m.111370 type:complete len:285 (-) Transcript_46811:176-1030(-)
MTTTPQDVWYVVVGSGHATKTDTKSVKDIDDLAKKIKDENDDLQQVAPRHIRIFNNEADIVHNQALDPTTRVAQLIKENPDVVTGDAHLFVTYPKPRPAAPSTDNQELVKTVEELRMKLAMRSESGGGRNTSVDLGADFSSNELAEMASKPYTWTFIVCRQHGARGSLTHLAVQFNLKGFVRRIAVDQVQCHVVTSRLPAKIQELEAFRQRVYGLWSNSGQLEAEEPTEGNVEADVEFLRKGKFICHKLSSRIAIKMAESERSPDPDADEQIELHSMSTASRPM